MSIRKTVAQLLCAAVLAYPTVRGHAQERPGYGTNVTIGQAKKIAAGALAEARKNNWNVAIAIVDTHGLLVYYEKMEDTQTASATIAVEKAKTAAMYRRTTRVMEESINKGRTSALSLPGSTPITGGLPIMMSGKVMGGIGVSGVTSDQDEQIAKAGLDGMP